MNSKNTSMSDQKQEDEEFYLKPFHELDDTLFHFTEDLKDPFCDDHQAYYRTSTNSEPNVRQSQKRNPNKKKKRATIQEENSSQEDAFGTDGSMEDNFDLPKRDEEKLNRPRKKSVTLAMANKISKQVGFNRKSTLMSSTAERSPTKVTKGELKIEIEDLKKEVVEELEDKYDERPGQNSKKINFAQHLEELKNRTEVQLPYTLTQCEDAMYIDRNTVVTLEYHYYQKNCSYSKMQRRNEKWDVREAKEILYDMDQGTDVNNKLGTQNYLSIPDDSEYIPTSHFDKRGMVNLHDDGLNLIERQKQHPDLQEFMKAKPQLAEHQSKQDIEQNQKPKYLKQKSLLKKTPQHIRSKEEKRDTNLLCPVIALYRVTNDGKMQRTQEVDAKMGGYFNHTKHGCMELTRSFDQKLISICNFDSSNPSGHYFNVKAWQWKKLEPFKVSQKLNKGLNEFFVENKDSFDHLETIHFMGKNKYIQMVFVEKRERQFKEIQKYEVDINKKVTKSSLKKHLEQPSYIRRSDPRKARKYVFFEVATGKIVLQYGGVHAPLIAAQNQEDSPGAKKQKQNKKIEIYELGLILEEIAKKGFETKLNFLVTGDFLPQEQKDKNLIFRWGLCQVNIDFFTLLKQYDSPEAREEYIRNMIRQVPQHYHDNKPVLKTRTSMDDEEVKRMETMKKTIKTQESQDLSQKFSTGIKELVQECMTGYLYYQYDSHNILNQFFDWEINIQVSANKSRDQFAIINSPDQNGYNSNASYYVNGRQFLTHDIDPYYVKIPNDQYIEHGRNAFIKNELFYNIYSNNIYETSQKTYCLRLGTDDGLKKVIEFSIPIENAISEFDQWLQQKKEMSDTHVTDIFQTIYVQRGDQFATLQTRIPTSYIGNEVKTFEIVSRKSDQSSVQHANNPFFAYNLGMKKICFTNIDQRDTNIKKAVILNLQDKEQFVGFVQFNNYHEIGFVPINLRIECCTPFLYMTRVEGKFGKFRNHLNLILLDPFCDQIEAVLFTSNTVFDNDLFNNSDMVIKSIIQNNKSNRMDEDYNIYIWSQVPGKLIRSKMLVQNDSKIAEDSDVFEELQNEKSMRQHTQIVLQDIQMLQDQKSFIYYITKQNGECNIMEGNPKDPYIKNHQCIFSIKSSSILSFGYERGSFYIMDEEHTTRKLSRNENQRMLSLINEMKLKEIQRLDYTPHKYDDVILREFYSVFRSKIFYFYDIDGEPFPQGILEAEDLHPGKKEHESIQFQRGPARFEHSNRFYIVYRENSHFNSFVKVHLLPDSTERTLINDFQNFVDISTFLNNEYILIKIRRRFMVFSKNGNFINEMGFENNLLKHKQQTQDSGDDSEVKNYNIKVLKEKQIKKNKLNDHHQTKFKKHENIQDFLGNPYRVDDLIFGQKATEVNDYNRMVLIQFSQNIKYFLFYDTIDMKLIVYELNLPVESSSFFELDRNEKIQQSLSYCFKAIYEIDVNDSELFRTVYQQTTTDLMKHFQDNENEVMVDNEGRVKMFYVLAHNHEGGHHKTKNGENIIGKEIDEDLPDNSLQECNILGSIFQQKITLIKHPDGDKYKPTEKSICYNFNEKINFPISQAKKARQKLIDEQKKEVNMHIKNIRINQSRLPKNLHDYTEYDKYIQDLKVLEQMEFNNFNCNIFHQNLMVVSCGNYLMYGYLEKTKINQSLIQKKKKKGKKVGSLFESEDGFWRQYQLQKAKQRDLDPTVKEMSKRNQSSDLIGKLQSIACDFAKSVQILKIIETSQNNCLQIVAKDLDLNLLYVQTWDFEKNIEINGYQIKENSFNASSVGNHIIKGLNNKMNYLLNQNHFIDLEHNIPIKQKNVDQGLDSMVRYWNQLRNIYSFPNQKKSNYKNDMILGIEKSNCIYYNLSRIDVLLWKDIQSNGESLEIIQKSTQLMDFNIVLGSSSLFHYFADRPEIIEHIQGLISDVQMHRPLTVQEETLPLQILNQDKGLKSAVFRSLDEQSPKSFEIMIKLIKDFPHICISKLILKSLYYVISHPSDSVINFFDEIIYKPPQMQTSHMINYDESYGDDVVFSCHTSIVTKNLINLKFKEKYPDFVPIKDEAKKKTEVEICNFGEEFLEMKLHRKFDETNNVDDDEEKPPQRVSIEALDLDWLFVNNNGKRFIDLLVAENANINVLGQKSVKVFIDLLWQEYQPQIIYKILLPYFIYMLLMAILTGETVDFWSENKAQRLMHPTDKDIINLDFWITLRAFIFTGISMFIMMGFFALEITQMWKSETMGDYFGDFWNCLDVISLSFNYVFLVMFLIDLILKELYFGHNLILDIGSWCMFFMWIKVFYWFRLFTTYAKYIKLIIQTITDMRYFFAMVLIIMVSFGNFMFVANNTLEESAGDSYIQREYVPKVANLLNSILSVYMFGALGQFSQQTYIAGYEKYSASAMFILGTFMVSVVFMNMLIAIMSDTFANVESNKEINTLKEQIAMISDYEWLVDLQESFKDQKYVIRVAPYSGHMKDKDLVLDAINDFQNFLGKSIDTTNLGVIKRIDYVEANNKFQLNHQLDNILMMNKKLQELDFSSKKTDANGEEKANYKEAQGARVRAMDTTLTTLEKVEFGRVIKKKFAGVQDTSDERIHEITMDMLFRIDLDHSGQIDYEEFYEFFANNDEFVVSNENIRSMFLEFDKDDKDSEATINLEEFAHAIKSALTYAREQPEDDSSEKDKESSPESGENGHDGSDNDELKSDSLSD